MIDVASCNAKADCLESAASDIQKAIDIYNDAKEEMDKNQSNASTDFSNKIQAKINELAGYRDSLKSMASDIRSQAAKIRQQEEEEERRRREEEERRKEETEKSKSTSN